MKTLSPAEAAAILVDKVGAIPFGVDNAELTLLLVRAFHAKELRATAIPLDLPAVRAALCDIPSQTSLVSAA